MLCFCFVYLYLSEFALILRSGVNIVHFVLLCVFAFLIPCFDVSYDFNIKTMYGMSFSPAVCRRARVLFFIYVICVGLRMVVSRDRHGCDCMVVGFTTTCAIGAYRH